VSCATVCIARPHSPSLTGEADEGKRGHGPRQPEGAGGHEGLVEPGGEWLAIVRLSVYNVGMSERPLHEPTFLMLTALAKGPQHGYGIITDVEHISGGRVRLRAGTLYAALDRVVAEGLVEADRDEVVDGRLRRYYRLTQRGDDRLAAEVARIQHNAAVAAGRLEVRRRAFGGLA
jgi:DNA-binding PadR family transcriptional regulator